MYRPQRYSPAPAGLNPEYFAVPITQAMVNGGAAIAALAELQNIGIQMDMDFDFYMTGLAYSAPTNLNFLGIRLRDAWGVYLSQDYLLTYLYAYPAGVNPDRGGGFIPVFEPPVWCPAGSVLQMDVTNFSTSTGYVWANLELRGYKAVAPGACAA